MPALRPRRAPVRRVALCDEALLARTSGPRQRSGHAVRRRGPGRRERAPRDVRRRARARTRSDGPHESVGGRRALTLTARCLAGPRRAARSRVHPAADRRGEARRFSRSGDPVLDAGSASAHTEDMSDIAEEMTGAYAPHRTPGSERTRMAQNQRTKKAPRGRSGPPEKARPKTRAGTRTGTRTKEDPDASPRSAARPIPGQLSDVGGSPPSRALRAPGRVEPGPDPDPSVARPAPASEGEARDRADAEREIGSLIHAHLEVLHQVEPEDAMRAIEAIVPVAGELEALSRHFEALGAADLARDLRLSADRRRKSP